MTESVADDGQQHRLGNGTKMYNILSRCFTFVTRHYYQQSYTENVDNLGRLAQVLYVCD